MKSIQISDDLMSSIEKISKAYDITPDEFIKISIKAMLSKGFVVQGFIWWAGPLFYQNLF